MFSHTNTSDVKVLSNVPYMEVYDWENINITESRHWMKNNWKISVYTSIIYLILILLGKKLMSTRQKFDLRIILCFWNFGLAIFSTIAFFRTIPELQYVVQQHGFYYSICIRNHHNNATAFWGWLMAWSKILELGDTMFIILRKQPLIFLHWYHHISVLVYSWINYIYYDPAMRYFMTINLFVHGLMYSYYGLKAMQFKIPKKFSMMITAVQISQMIVGVYINLYTLWIKHLTNDTCDRSKDSVSTALIIYFSYFVLFSQFFRRSYITQNKIKEKSN